MPLPPLQPTLAQYIHLLRTRFASIPSPVSEDSPVPDPASAPSGHVPRPTKVAHEYHTHPQKPVHSFPPAVGGFPAGSPPSPYDYDNLVTPESLPNAQYFLTIHGVEFGPDYISIPPNRNVFIQPATPSHIEVYSSTDTSVRLAFVESYFAIDFSPLQPDSDGDFDLFAGTYICHASKWPNYPLIYTLRSSITTPPGSAKAASDGGDFVPD
jgi:hypothetical protein